MEDATDIILNLKQIPSEDERASAPRRSTYAWTSRRRALRGMSQDDADVDVLDKDVYIATVSEGGKPAHRDAR